MKRLLILVLLLFGLLASVLIYGFLAQQSPFATNPLGFSHDEVVEVSLTLAPADERERVEFSTSAPAAMHGIVSSMRRGYLYFFNHRCMWLGTLRVELQGGRTEDIDIRPGHEEYYYEIRSNDTLYRIRREPFIASMEALGVPGSRLLGFPDPERERTP